VREIALQFGEQFGLKPEFIHEEGSSALLSNPAKACELFGQPAVSPHQMIEWIAAWLKQGGEMLNKPTHFQTRDGKF
jgi:hypothetical protein